MDDIPYRLPLLLDGATCSNLIDAGMPEEACMEQWILEHPEKLRALQTAFIRAGSEALYAPTLGASVPRLARYGLAERADEINHALVRLTKETAAPHGVLVGGELSSTGLLVAPHGKADFDDIYDIYRGQVRSLEKAGVDFLVVESQTSLADMRAAVLAARTEDLPIFVTLELDENGRTSTGGSLLSAVITLQAMGVEAIGVNCSGKPSDLLEFIDEVQRHAAVPILAKPNVGFSLDMQRRNADTPYLSPAEFAEEMRALMKAGARIVGGCCGVTPAHIEALAPVAREFGPPLFSEEPDCHAAAIEGEAFFLSEDIEFSEPLVCDSGLETDLIDLEDERITAALVRVESIDDARRLSEASSMARLPIAVQCDSKPVLDAALRYFQGRLIVDSNCLLEEEVLVPLCAKYGAILY